jgi:hypothetical protein
MSVVDRREPVGVARRTSVYPVAVVAGAAWSLLLGRGALEAACIVSAVLVGALQQGLP